MLSLSSDTDNNKWVSKLGPFGFVAHLQTQLIDAVTEYINCHCRKMQEDAGKYRIN
jgi:hypothetical protein